MKRIALVLAALAATPALAGNTQVDPNKLKAAGATGHYYGRSDGLFQDSTSKGLVIVGNGTRAGIDGKTFYEDFTQWGAKNPSCLKLTDGTLCGGATTTVPVQCEFPDGFKINYRPIVTDTLCPIGTAAGFDITGDLTDDDGKELTLGGGLGSTGGTFFTGTDPAFEYCVTATITDVSGSDKFTFGLRSANEAFSTSAAYSEFVSIGSISGELETITNKAAGGAVTTDTTNTWADTTKHQVCIFVSGAGVVTYTYDGAAPTTTAAFTFTAGTPVIPFIFFLQDADIAETTSLQNILVAYQ